LIIASGENFPDALAGAQLATATRPLLLVRKDSVPQATLDWISDYKSNFANGSKSVFVLGGESVISADTLTAIQSAITTAGSLTPPVMRRLSGADRYATAKAISDYTNVTQASDKLIIVNGQSFADALSAGAIAAKMGWPMILTPSTGLNASVKAKLDSFIAVPGGTDEFVIIGSAAVVPMDIEEYIISTKGVAASKIRRIQGADRYQTNFLTNANYLDYGLGGGYTGQNVALVSGENWPDALAFAGFGLKTDTHLVLTPTAGGDLNVATLAATLAGANAGGYGIAAGGTVLTNQRVFIIGGTAAVSNAAKIGYVAASGNDLTTSLSCTKSAGSGVGGSKKVTLTISSRLPSTGYENAALTSTSAVAQFLKKNNVLLTGSVSGAADAAVVSPTRVSYTFELTAPLATTDVITFAGISEGDTLYGSNLAPRTIAGSSCTVEADVTRPSVTITGSAGDNTTTSASGGYFWINASEPITVGSGLAIQTNGTANTYISLNSLNPTLSATIVPLGDGSDVGGASNYYTDFLMVLDDVTSGLKDGRATLVEDYALVVSASAFVDAAGLSPASAVTASVDAADTTAPTLTAAAVTSVASVTAEYNASPLSVSATTTGAYHGAKGSGFALSVVNQRGLLKPTIAIDGTAKTMVVTADTGYHTPADVKTALANIENSDWAIGASTGKTLTTKLNATVAAASCLASHCGKDLVTVLISGDEPMFGLSSGYSIAVGGYGTPFVDSSSAGLGDQGSKGYGGIKITAAGAQKVNTARVLAFTTQFEGTATVSFQGASAAVSGITDVLGNYLTSPVTFTVT